MINSFIIERQRKELRTRLYKYQMFEYEKSMYLKDSSNFTLMISNKNLSFAKMATKN